MRVFLLLMRRPSIALRAVATLVLPPLPHGRRELQVSADLCAHSGDESRGYSFAVCPPWG